MLDALGAVAHVDAVVRRLARCSLRSCRASWTIYEPGGYPHRSFHLPVVASAVNAVTNVGKSVATVAQEHQCSGRAVRRWVEWVAHLFEPAQITRACAQLDPAGMAGCAASATGGGRAGAVLRGLERLGDVLSARGVRLPETRSGLARILTDQQARLGEVVYLTKSSPPLRVSLARWLL
jgi:hypothetical protein